MFFTQADLIKFLEKIIANSSELIEVNFSKVETRWDYTQEEANWIVDALVKNTNIRKVNLESCPIGDEGAIRLALAWEKLPNMVEADLSNCGIGVKGAASLIHYSKLKLLNLSHNKDIVRVSISAFDSFDLHLKKRLAALSDDKYCEVNNDELLILEEEMGLPNSTYKVDRDIYIPDLWEALGKNQFLLVLKFNRINIPIPNLAIGIRTNTVLSELHLDGCEITCDNIDPLSEALHYNRTLQVLNLRCNNRIGGVGTKKLASMLMVNATLVELNLQFCEILDVGALAISAALQINKTLKVLSIGYNKISLIGLKPILHSAGEHPDLKVLNLEDNVIGEEGGLAVADLIVKNTQLKKLDLFGVGLTLVAVKAIAAALSANEHLTYIRLSGNKFGNESALVIGEMLLRNNSLRNIGLRGCGFNSSGITILSHSVKLNFTLLDIDIDVNSVLLSPYYKRNKTIQEPISHNPYQRQNLLREVLRSRKERDLSINLPKDKTRYSNEVPSLQTIVKFSMAFFKEFELVEVPVDIKEEILSIEESKKVSGEFGDFF